jgi:hypothetical protein
MQTLAQRLPLLILLAAAAARATVLGDLAASLKEGQWAELKTNGYTDALITTGTDNILNYSSSAVWDPIKKEIRFVGQGHQEAEKMIVYSDADNTWRNAPSPGGGGIGHGYDHNALDPKTGIEFYRKFASTQVLAYNGSWSADPALPGNDNDVACCGSLTFFPDMNALTFWGGGALYVMKNGKWSQAASGLPMGEYHNVSEYSPAYGMVYGGGGNDDNHLYGLSASGKVLEIASAPLGLGIYSALMVADPVSGELVVFGKDRSLWSYYPGLSTWAKLGAPNVKLFDDGDNPIEWMVGASVSTYKVLVIVKKSAIFVYKHKPQGPIPVLRPLRERPRAKPGALVLSLDGRTGAAPWDLTLGWRDPAGRMHAGAAEAPAGFLLPPAAKP